MPAMALSISVLAPVIAVIAVRFGTVAAAEAEAEAELNCCCCCCCCCCVGCCGCCGCFGCLVRFRPIGLVMERPVAMVGFAPLDGLVGWRGGDRDCGGDCALAARSDCSTIDFLVMFTLIAHRLPGGTPGGWPRGQCSQEEVPSFVFMFWPSITFYMHGAEERARFELGRKEYDRPSSMDGSKCNPKKPIN